MHMWNTCVLSCNDKKIIDYKKNNELPDIYGYLDPSDSEYEMTLYYYSYIKGYYNIPEQDDI